ncbi:MAG: NAD(P)-dependent oxidoreductase [Pseudomonadota bacterium]
MSTTVGFVGLGRMGRPMAGHLRAEGFTVQGYDANPNAAQGLNTAATLEDAVRGAAVVVTMLPGPAEVRAVVETGILPHAAPGTLVVDASTIDPRTTDDLATRCRAAGLAFVDAPVGRTAAHADRAECLFMVGAEPDELEQLRPLLEAMGTTVVHCGPVGTGIRTKLVNNLLAIALAQLNSEVLALSQAFGLDPATTLGVLTGTTATNGHLTANFPNKVLKGDTSPGFAIDLAHKDLSLALESAGALDVPLPMGAVARECLALARADGRGGSDFSALLDHWCARAGVASPRL